MKISNLAQHQQTKVADKRTTLGYGAFLFDYNK